MTPTCGPTARSIAAPAWAVAERCWCSRTFGLRPRLVARRSVWPERSARSDRGLSRRQYTSLFRPTATGLETAPAESLGAETAVLRATFASGPFDTPASAMRRAFWSERQPIRAATGSVARASRSCYARARHRSDDHLRQAGAGGISAPATSSRGPCPGAACRSPPRWLAATTLCFPLYPACAKPTWRCSTCSAWRWFRRVQAAGFGLAALLSVVCFDFFFVEPRFTTRSPQRYAISPSCYWSSNSEFRRWQRERASSRPRMRTERRTAALCAGTRLAAARTLDDMLAAATRIKEVSSVGADPPARRGRRLVGARSGQRHLSSRARGRRSPSGCSPTPRSRG